MNSARGLMDLAVARQLAIGNGILTVDTEAQAQARAVRRRRRQRRRRRARRAWPWSRSSVTLAGTLMARDAPPRDKDARKANRRGAARLAAVQALYQMDLAGTGLNEILAEFESHWIGREVEGAQYLPAEAAFFRDIVSGVVREQRALDPQIDEALAKRWPLKRIEAILRAALRAGAYELDHRRDVPARVVVSEYADVAAAFVERDETGMVNAVLDQLARKLRARRVRPGRRVTRWPAHDDMSAEDRLIARFFAAAGDPSGRARACPTMPPSSSRRRAATWCSRPTPSSAACISLPTTPPHDVASKALRVNLSDLAAKGAKPLGFLLSLALPKDIGETGWPVSPKACASDAVLFGCPLFGGDTDRTPGPIMRVDRHVRQRAGRHDGAPRRRQAGRPRLRQRHHRRCRARPCRCARARPGS